MVKKEHQILGVDLGIINQAGKSAGLSLQPENLDLEFGFAEDTEQSFDAFSKVMETLEKENNSREDLDDHDLFIISLLRYKRR